MSSWWYVLPQISLSDEMILPRISHTEVIVLSRGCTCLRSALPLARARSAPTQQNLYSPTEFRTEHSCWVFSHRFHRFTQNFLTEKTPTDFTEHTELSCWDILPQISQIYTELSCWDILPQISQNTQNFLAEIFSHRFHRFTQNFLAEKNSVKSVDSVGSIRTLISVRICEICGSFFNYKLRVDSVGSIRTLISVRICFLC